jgi:hypothetical protein
MNHPVGCQVNGTCIELDYIVKSVAGPLSLAELIRPGCRVALADGVSCPLGVLPELSAAARAAGGVDLLLGWAPAPLDDLDFGAFAVVRTLMAGYALRKPVDDGLLQYIPARVGTWPALLHGPLRRDVVVAAVSGDAARLVTEVAWMRAVVDSGAVVAAVQRQAAPVLDIGPPLPAGRVVVVGVDPAPPVEVDWGTPTDVHQVIGERIARLVPAGARVQYGPGVVGTAAVDAITVPVRVDTGIVTDAVLDLDHRGLLQGRALAPYVAGAARLYEWATGRVDVDRIEHTHDPGRLAAAPPLVAINTALEVDHDGQVNVEQIGSSAVAGIGGQPDYAAGAARSPGGLSIVAVPSTRRGHATLVERLSAPVTTPSHDVDVLVTEVGVADLRGLDRAGRRRAIASLWR